MTMTLGTLPKIEVLFYFLLWSILFLLSAFSLFLTSHNDVNKSLFVSSSLLESSFISTLRDTKDTEWSLVYAWLSQSQWLVIHLLFTIIIPSKALQMKFVHIFISCGILSIIISPVIVGICVFLSIVYYVVGYLFKSKFLIWIVTLGTFAMLEHMTKIILSFRPHDPVSFQQFTIIQSSLALIIIRVTSIGLEHANTATSFPKSIVISQISLEGLLEALLYALYPPTFLFGPITLFGDWCVWRQLQIPNLIISQEYKGGLSHRRLSFHRLAWRGIRLIFWFFVWELVLHTVYPNALIFSMTQPAMDVKPSPITVNNSFHGSPHIVTDRWALASAVYLLSLQFFFSYMQLYGWPGLLSDVEMLLSCNKIGLEDEQNCLVPDGPPCFSHTLLFSEIWRKFDRGLYNFLKWYVYLPWLKPIQNRSEEGKYLGISLLQRLQAGTLCFLFVLIYHSWNQENVVWVSVNMLQILLERCTKWAFLYTYFGTFMKQKLPTTTFLRLTGILCGFSAIFSSIGFFYFNQGYITGQWIAHWMLYDSVYRVVAVVLYYITYQMAVETRRWCNYAA